LVGVDQAARFGAVLPIDRMPTKAPRIHASQYGDMTGDPSDAGHEQDTLHTLGKVGDQGDQRSLYPTLESRSRADRRLDRHVGGPVASGDESYTAELPS